MSLPQTKRLTQWNERNRNLIQSCWSGTAPRSKAIKAACLECVGEDVDAVRECADTCCPPWRYRPFQVRNSKGAIRETLNRVSRKLNQERAPGHRRCAVRTYLLIVSRHSAVLNGNGHVMR